MRITTRSVARSTLVAIMTAFAALILGVTQTLTTAVTASLGLTAVQALIVPGTGTPNPLARTTWTTPSTTTSSPAVTVWAMAAPAVAASTYIATVLADPVARMGWAPGREVERLGADGVTSLNGTVHRRATRRRRQHRDLRVFAGRHGRQPLQARARRRSRRRQGSKRTTSSSATRSVPTAGSSSGSQSWAMSRSSTRQFGDPTPTDTCTDAAGVQRCATDFALMYDGVVDFPEWILNPLALVNAAAGFQYVHGTYLAPNGDDPRHRNAVRLHRAGGEGCDRRRRG